MTKHDVRARSGGAQSLPDARPAASPLNRFLVLRPPNLPPLVSYAAAPALSFLAFVIQRTIVPHPSIAPFVLFYAAVALSAWLGGRGPGLLTTVLSGLTANYFFIAPFNQFDFHASALISTLFFFCTAGIGAMLTGSLRTAMARADERAALLHQSEKQARARATELQALLDAVPVGVLLSLDRESTQLEANRTFRELLGLPQGEGLSDIPPEQFRAYKDGKEVPRKELPARAAAATGVAVSGEEFDFVLRDGATRHVLFNAAPLLDERGLPRGSVAAMLDMTDLKRAEEELKVAKQRLESLLENSPLAVVEWSSADFRIVRWSDEATKVFGWTAEEAVGKRIDELNWIHPEDRSLVERAMADMVAGRSTRTVARNRNLRKDGSVIHCEWYNSTLHGPGDTISVLSLVLDVTERKRAEEAYRQASERLAMALQGAKAGSFDRDLASGHLEWSPELFELLGVSPSTFAPTLASWEALVHPEDRLTVSRNIEEAIAHRTPLNYEYRVRRSDGRLVWIQALGEARYDGQGRPVRMVGICLDITDRKRAEEEERRNQSLLAQAERLSHSGAWEVDLTSAEASVSEEWQAIFGLHRRTFPADDLRRLIHPEDLPKVTAAFEAAIQGGAPFSIEHRIVRQDNGEPRVVKASAVVVRSSGGRPVKLRGAVQDVTEIRQTEEALREADRRKNEFLGMLSHELRNPLTPIRNSLYILERAAAGGEQARRARSIIDRQVGHLARLVDDLLDVTRISRGKIRLTSTRLDLVQLVNRTVEDHRSLFDERDLSVELPGEPIWVSGDATRLAQVVGNLLNNSAKFTPEEGRVSVSLSSSETRARLEIADTGIGIDADTLKRLFQPFSQADRTLDRSRGGLGLGLALVRGLVELHGGEVSVHSAGPGKGARFTVELPLEQPETAVLPSQQPDPATRARRVLIIEDNRDAAASLAEALQLSGHRVAVAHDGESGQALARSLRPEVVLCDIGLPAGLDGYAVARALRRHPATADSFLIALTGYAQPEDQRLAREAGFDAHLAKPPDLATLERLLAQLPDRSQQDGHAAAPPA